jgi:hypothetical protein
MKPAAVRARSAELNYRRIAMDGLGVKGVISPGSPEFYGYPPFVGITLELRIASSSQLEARGGVVTYSFTVA